MVKFKNLSQPFFSFQDGFRALQRGKRKYFRDTDIQRAASDLVQRCAGYSDQEQVNSQAARDTGARRRDQATANIANTTPDVSERQEMGMLNSLTGNRCVLTSPSPNSKP